MIRKQVFKGKILGRPIKEKFRDVREKSRERKIGCSFDGYDSGFTAGVEKCFVMWFWENMAVEAYH